MEKFEQNCVNECCEPIPQTCYCSEMDRNLDPKQEIRGLKNELRYAYLREEENRDEIRKLNLKVDVLTDLFSVATNENKSLVNELEWARKRLEDYRGALCGEIHDICYNKRKEEASGGKKLNKEFKEFVDKILDVVNRF